MNFWGGCVHAVENAQSVKTVMIGIFKAEVGKGHFDKVFSTIGADGPTEIRVRIVLVWIVGAHEE